MMLIPYRLETIYTRLPYANSAIIAINTLIFFLIAFGGIAIEDAESMILRDWDLSQMIGSTFLHANLFHLLGNMIFLWVFGNAVAATVGSVAYPFLYLFLGLSASVAHMTFGGQPALGASGAINGIVGMSLVLFPVNRLHCWYFFSFPFMGILWKSGRIKVRAYWMIIAWTIFDVIGMLVGGDNIGHWAHLGGFVTGLLAGSALLYFNVIETYDPTIFDVLAGRPLERTNYDLNEIAAMPLPAGSAVPVQPPNGFSRSPGPLLGLKHPPSVPSALLGNPLPLFRVTNILQKGNELLVFFVNEGDPVKSVSLVPSDGVRGSLQPAFQIGKREMGTMRLANVVEASLGTLDLNISFSTGSQKTVKRLIFDETSKTFKTG